MNETAINHGALGAPAGTPTCRCGAVLMRNISIREGRCQACRNQDGAGPALLETFCDQLNSSPEGWRVVTVSETECVWQHNSSGIIFSAKVG